MVIGTTGLDPQQTAAIHEAAKKVPIMWAANMSLGVNILLALVEKTASMLDPSYDIEVLEMHHRHKIDAPSGTALALGRAAAAGRQVKLEKVWRKSRDGHTGARPTGEIGFATLRGGEEVGVHTVMFAAAGERLELSHRAFSRETYAAGAVRAPPVARGQEARPLRHEGRAGPLGLVPVVLVTRRAHLGERRLELVGDVAALAGAEEAADHHAVAARDHDQPLAAARPAANRRRAGAPRARRRAPRASTISSRSVSTRVSLRRASR